MSLVVVLTVVFEAVEETEMEAPDCWVERVLVLQPFA